jgi:hypothetical protein
MGVSGQRHTPAALCLGERTPGTYWIGGWVDPRAGLDTQTLQEKSFAFTGDPTPIAQSVVRHYTDWATDTSIKDRVTPCTHPFHTYVGPHTYRLEHCTCWREIWSSHGVEDVRNCSFYPIISAHTTFCNRLALCDFWQWRDLFCSTFSIYLTQLNCTNDWQLCHTNWYW